MAEFTAVAQQTVEPNQVILFTDTPVRGNNSIMHRDGSGLVSLRGLTCCQPRARFKVSFGGNIAIPTGGTVDAISVAIAIDGEPVASTKMIVTPAAVEEFFNVSRDVNIDVPAGCYTNISVKNTSDQAINVQNANITLGGTGILIVVGVALETYKQLEGSLLTRQYRRSYRRR